MPDNHSKKTPPQDVLAGGPGSGLAPEESPKPEIPPARQRVRYNKYGEELTRHMGVQLPKKLYDQYRTHAHFHGGFVRDYIRDAMLAYLPELKKSQTQKLLDAGQAPLPDL